MSNSYFKQLAEIESVVVSGGSDVYPIPRAGYFPRVLSYTIGMKAGGTIRFQDGATPITGVMPVAANGMIHTSLNPLGHFQAGGGTMVISAVGGDMGGHMTVEWLKKPGEFTIPLVIFSASIDPELIAFWRFDSAANIGLDAWTGGIDLPVLSGSPDPVPGKHNQAMQLNLGDALERPSDPTLGLDAWTFFGWVRLNDPMSDFTLLSNWHGPDQRSWAVFHSGHRFRTAYSTDGDNDIREQTNNVNTQSMPAGSWVFVVARFNRVLGISRIQATVAGDAMDTNIQDTLLGPIFNNIPNDCLSIGTELSPAATAEADFDSMGLLDFWAPDAVMNFIYNGGAGIG